MSIKIEIVVQLEDSKAKEKIEENQELVDDTSEKIEQNEEAAKKSFKEVMGYMRATYSIISGVSRVLGGGMSQVFSSMYMVAMSAIGFYKALIPAALATPGGQIQAAIMGISVFTATSSLISIMAGQRDLSTKIRGINMTLHGISSIIGGFNFK